MTTMTATPNLERGTVVIRISATTQITKLVRADVNGTRPVRLLPGALPRTGEIVIVDYEPSLSGGLEYRLNDGTSAWATLDGVQLPRFILPHLPAFQVIVETVTGHTAGRESRSTVHEVLNRDDPLVILGRLRTRRGTLEIIAQDYRHAQDLEAIFERGQVVLYRQPENPGLDMYLVASRVSSAPVADVWQVTAEYVEVTFPSGNIASRSGWTYDALADDAANFEEIATDYRTFWDVAIGEKIL